MTDDARDRRILRQYEAASAALDEKPSERTRAAILAAAARAAGARPQPVGRLTRWRLPLAAAASLLVGTIAVLLATRIDDAEIEALPAEQAAKVTVAPAAQTAPAREAAAPPAAIERAGAEKPSTALDGAKQRRDEAGRAPAGLDERRQAIPDAAPARARPAAPAVAAAPTTPAAAPATPPEMAAAPASPATSAAEAAAQDPIGKTESLRSAPAAAAPGFAKRSAEGIADGRAAGNRVDAAKTWRSTPQDWIEHIGKLREQGRHHEADAELALLRRRHPELRLPPAVLPPPGR